MNTFSLAFIFINSGHSKQQYVIFYFLPLTCPSKQNLPPFISVWQVYIDILCSSSREAELSGITEDYCWIGVANRLLGMLRREYKQWVVMIKRPYNLKKPVVKSTKFIIEIMLQNCGLAFKYFPFHCREEQNSYKHFNIPDWKYTYQLQKKFGAFVPS